jgi:flagellar biosynthetic protein FliS
MQNPYAAKQTGAYLAQRIDAASAEELAAMLLEGAERFLGQAATAIRRKDNMEKARLLNRAAKIMNHLLGMLNPEADRNVVDRLHGIYIWWIKEMFEGSRKNRPEQIETVIRQMDDLRRQFCLCIRNLQTRADARLSTEEMVG